jgi:hydrogenase-4 component B
VSGVLLAAAVAVPALLTLLALVPPWRSRLVPVLPLAPLPALLAALLVPEDTTLSVPWLLLGGTWALDAVRRLLLAQMALVWALGALVAARHADTAPRLPTLTLPWLLTLTGATWVALAHDIAGFYSAFALLSFGAYPLVVARGGPDTVPAGRRYLVYTVGAEMALLVGLLGASARGAGQSLAGVASVLTAAREEPVGLLLLLALLIGFGVKSALLGVHGWLPATYTVAPAPVRVVLGGALINAGVLGWLVTLPLGAAAFPTVGTPLVAVGLLAAIGGALRGTLLARVPTMLGWSSVSQMGLVTLLLGVALVSERPESAAVLALYAVQHGLAKGALFAGSAAHWPLPLAGRWLLLVPALALAGAPLTSGAVAKLGLKQLLTDAGLSALVPWTSVAAIGTTLLLTRVWWQVLANTGAADTPPADTRSAGGVGDWPWPLFVLAVASAVWWWPVPIARDAGVSSALALGWPLVAGVLAALALRRWLPIVATISSGAPGQSAHSAPPSPVPHTPVTHTADESSPRRGASDPSAVPEDQRPDRSERAELLLRRALPWGLGVVWLGAWLALSVY